MEAKTVVRYLYIAIAGGFGLLLDVLAIFFPAAMKTEFSASFIPARKLLKTYNQGFAIGGRALPIKRSFEGAIIFGGSGTGKSVTVAIPSILNLKGTASMVIHDCSRELLQKTGMALEKAKMNVLVLDFANPERSIGWNPLARIKSRSDITKLAKLLVRSVLGEPKGDPFWNLSAENLIAVFIRYVVEYAAPEHRHLHQVYQLITAFNAFPDQVDVLFARTHDRELIAQYKALVSTEGKTLSSILATAKTALSIFADEAVAKVTSTDTLDMAAFRDHPTALFIQTSVADAAYYAPLSSLLFDQLSSEIVREIPPKTAIPIFFVLDEANSLVLPSLSGMLAVVRKHRAGILLLYQDYHQLVALYGVNHARNITANCYAKVYMPGQPIAVAQELETVFGRFQYEDEKTQATKTRQLMVADEIRMSVDTFVLCGNAAPIRMQPTPYFKHWKYSGVTKLPPLEVVGQVPLDMPETITFEL